MSEVMDKSQQTTEQPAAQVADQSEDQALASAMAGYNKTRGEEPPVGEETRETSMSREETHATETPAAPAAKATDPSPAQQPQPTPAVNVSELADELKALREKIKSTSGDTETIRKMHGEIGNINRTLIQLQQTAKPSEAPVKDELTDAIEQADAVATEFPELAGPIVKLIKSMKDKFATQAQPAVDVTALVSTEVGKLRSQSEKDAIVVLAEEHPDYATVRETPGFTAWISKKTPAYQEMFWKTWSPDVVSKTLTEYKASLKPASPPVPPRDDAERTRKQARLESNVTPIGVPNKAGSSTLPDEEGLFVGYNKGRKRL